MINILVFVKEQIAKFKWITPFAATGGVKIGNTGTITLNGAKVFNSGAPLTINSGATMATNDYQLTLAGNLVNSGTFTPGAGTVLMNGAAQSISGSSATTFNNLTVAGSGTKTFSTIPVVNGTLSMEGTATVSVAPTYGSSAVLQYNTNTARTAGVEWITPFAPTGGVKIGNTGTITLNGAKVFNSNVPLTINSGVALATNSYQLTLGGNFANNGTFTAGTGTVVMNGTDQSISGSTATAFNNLTFSGGGTKTLGSSVSVNGTLTLNGALVALGSYNLTLGTSAPAVAGTFGSSNMIVATGSGELRKVFGATGSYTYPVGDVTGTPEYSPMTLNFTSGTFSSAYAGVRVTNQKHPSNSSLDNYLNRYWSVSQSGISAFSCNVTGNYVNSDISGVETDMIAGKYSGTLPWTKYSVLGSNTFTANGVASFGDFSGLNNVPVVATSTSSLSGFTYGLGSGPSAEQSFTVSGSDLSGNVVLTPSTDFEISTRSGVSFVASSSISLTPSGGTLAATPIYVRMKSGLAAGTYSTSETINITSTGVKSKTVALSGTVTPPVINTSVSSLSGFTYGLGSGPSPEKSFTVSGSDLSGNIVLTPATDFEISTGSGTSFVASSSITLTPIARTVASATIYVRMKAGLGVGSYSASETINITSAGATSKTVALSGTVTPPVINTSVSSLSGFAYLVGSGPSPEKSFTVSGSDLSGNIVLTPASDFEISTGSGASFVASSSIALTPAARTVSTTTIYVRLKAGLSTGSYSTSETISITSPGATSKTVDLSGTVTPPDYCSMVANTSYGTSITSVAFNTINQTSAKPSGYSNYTAVSTNVTLGSSYNLTVKVNTAGNYTVYTRAWIDWNFDGDFADAGESYDLGSASNVTNGTSSLCPLSITVPEAATIGTLRMRVATRYASYPVLCNSNFDGETEDYSIVVVAPVITTGTISGSPFSTGGSVSIPFTVTGAFRSGNTFTAQLSDASGSFASPYAIGTTSGTTSGTITGVIPTGAVTGTGYRIRIVANSPLSIGSDNGANLTINQLTGLFVTPESLAGFSYQFNMGPSPEKTFGVTGNNLTANVYITPPADYEVSDGSGASFVAANPLILPIVNGTVNKTIYVRLKAGLSTGTYSTSETISITSSGTPSKTVTLSGTVTPPDYCSMVANTWYGTSITSVAFNTINQTSAKPSGYSNYTGVSTNVTLGSSYNLTVKLNTDGNYTIYSRAWIDWNYDGDFADAGESYNLGSAINATNGTTSLCPLSITVPTTATLGTLRMRIACMYGSYPTLCETSFDGETEDYSIVVTAPVITTGTISGSPFSSGGTVSIPFAVSGAFRSGNTFTAQLSDATGSFASPYAIGTTSGTTSGTITGAIPMGAVTGTGYRIRVVANSPVSIGSDNGANLTINQLTGLFVNPASLSDFSYQFNLGPSPEKTFGVTGSNLTANVYITPPADYEVSVGTGGSFVAANPLILPVVSGAVNKTIYVRLKGGLTVGNYNSETITVESENQTTKTVVCSGSVASGPTLTASSSISSSLSYTYMGGPSSSATFTVSGSYLADTVFVTPPTGYEISTSSGGTYQTTAIKLNQAKSATLATTTIYIRLKTGLGIGSQNGTVTVSTLGATTQYVACTGTINPAPTLITNTSSLACFIYASGGGPSGEQSFVLKGTNLTGNVTVTPPANFAISTTSGSGFSTSAITLTPTSGTVNATLYVRMVEGLAVSSYGPANVSLNSAGAVVKTVALSGSVVSSATILTSKSTLTGFGYLYNTGPSGEQEFTVSGASLTSAITITAPANFEISRTSGSGFQSTAITLTQSGGLINPTKIYVRLKGGLAAGNYTNANIVASSNGATTKNVACVGIVFVSPLISAGGGGTYCQGSTVFLTSTGADIVNRYWQGPNAFYSILQNPSIANATSAASGTYTVTGNVYVGGNLVTNGDFESGNTSFGSSYGYAGTGTDALWNESLYAVVANPNSVHSNFSVCVDHTVGGAIPSGKQMVINGSPTAGVVIWSQSVPVVSGANYEFSYWVQTVCLPSPSQLQLYVNGVPAGPVYTAENATCTWKQFVYNTTVGAGVTSANLELINQNTSTSGNDFALDDIVFRQILMATSSTNVTVSNSLPVSVSVSASSNPVYANTPVTFTATAVNGGDAPVYQWKVNGVNVGTNSSTYTYTPQNGQVVSCVLTSSYPCSTGNPATSSVTMTVTARSNYWMGSIDTDWGKAGNWTANSVPLTGDDVEYATLANYGSVAVNDLRLDANRTIGNLINATTKRLVIPSAKTLTVNSMITTDNNPDRIYIHCDSLHANGSLIFHNPSTVPVYATVEMYSKAFINPNGPVNGKFQWQYFGIPLESVAATPTFDKGYVRKWDESGNLISNHWVELNNSSVLAPFLGYEICQPSPKVYYFKGKLVNRDFNSGQLAVTQSALYPGQHIFANPYTAAIDIRQLAFGSSTEQSVYLYNAGSYNQWTNGGATGPGNAAGQYTVSTKNTAGNSGVPRQIPSMQAMLVKAMNVSSTATFAFTYNSVVMGNTEMQRAPVAEGSSSDNEVSTIVDLEGSCASDRVWIFTEPSCSRTFDNGWDGVKIPGTPLVAQIYATEPDGNYQINVVDDMNDTKLAFQAGTDVKYTLKFTHKNIKRYYPGVYLVDLVENKIVDVTESGSQYSFLAESTPSSVDRFKIVTRRYESEIYENQDIKVISANGMIFIHNFSSSKGDVMIYDISGHYIKKVPFAANGITMVATGLKAGAYITKCTTEKEESTKRVIVR